MTHTFLLTDKLADYKPEGWGLPQKAKRAVSSGLIHQFWGVTFCAALLWAFQQLQLGGEASV